MQRCTTLSFDYQDLIIKQQGRNPDLESGKAFFCRIATLENLSRVSGRATSLGFTVARSRTFRRVCAGNVFPAGVEEQERFRG